MSTCFHAHTPRTYRCSRAAASSELRPLTLVASFLRIVSVSAKECHGVLWSDASAMLW